MLKRAIHNKGGRSGHIPQENGYIMAYERKVQVTVATVFDGKQDARQVFIDLILKRHREKMTVVSDPVNEYNRGKVFSDVRVERKEKIV